MTEQLVGAERVQELLGVDRSTVYRMASDGRLPAVKVGRQWRFPLDRVQQRLRPESCDPCERPELELDRAAVEPLLAVVAEALGVMMVVADMHGQALTRVVNPCPWFVANGDDPAVLDACLAERRELAASLDFVPRFQRNRFGYDCARAFVRSGSELVGIVVAGGLEPLGGHDHPDGLHALDSAGRERVLEALPRVAAALSRLAGHPADEAVDPALVTP